MIKVIKSRIIQRRYPQTNWDYKAISVIINDDGKLKDVVYYTLINKGVASKGVEIFSGYNYIVGSNDSSHSRNYKLNDVPKKYSKVVMSAMMIFNKTQWSDAKKVDLN